MDTDILSTIGLTSDESNLYLTLLDTGGATATLVSEKSGIKRTYVYAIAQQLKKKGLLVIEKKGKKTMFIPNSPDYLLHIAEEVESKTSAAVKKLESQIDNLKLKYSSVEQKPIVKTFEGFSGLKKIYLDTLSEGEKIYAFLQNTEIDPEFRKWLREHYLKERVAKKIEADVIIASGEKSKMYLSESREYLRKSIEVDSANFPFEVEVNIYGKKVSFVNFSNKDNPIGVIIENKQIASTLKAFFGLCWSRLERG
jgi:sugar-specific transcriptional regulator TrmB